MLFPAPPTLCGRLYLWALKSVIRLRFYSMDSPMHAWNATRWLWGRFWGWPSVGAFVALLIAGVSVLVPYAFYGPARGLILACGLLLLAKLVADALGSGKPATEQGVLLLLSTVVTVSLVVGGLWVVRKVEWQNEIKVKPDFKASPVLTERRQEKITWEINRYYHYLSDVGFDPPTKIPIIGTLSTAIGGTVLQGPENSQMNLSEERIDDPRIPRMVYSMYAFQELFKANPASPETDWQWRASYVYDLYYVASFDGQYTYSNAGQGLGIWNDALWDVRAKLGKKATDAILLRSFKNWAPKDRSTPNFDCYFLGNLMTGQWVADGSETDWDDIRGILKARGLNCN
jgi:hypothetical protein